MTLFRTRGDPEAQEGASQFPYALWRDSVWDRDLSTVPRPALLCFHTPCGVTLFGTSGLTTCMATLWAGFYTPCGVTLFGT